MHAGVKETNLSRSVVELKVQSFRCPGCMCLLQYVHARYCRNMPTYSLQSNAQLKLKCTAATVCVPEQGTGKATQHQTLETVLWQVKTLRFSQRLPQSNMQGQTLVSFAPICEISGILLQMPALATR